MPSTLYVLSCEGESWYVGTTSSPLIRIPGHFRDVVDGWTPKWLISHKPIKVHECYEILESTNSSDEENKKTEELIELYGIDKVSGGKYVYPVVRAAYIRKKSAGSKFISGKVA
jgi:hypothetical protein